jgi:hypothetical protein
MEDTLIFLATGGFLLDVFDPGASFGAIGAGASILSLGVISNPNSAASPVPGRPIVGKQANSTGRLSALS